MLDVAVAVGGDDLVVGRHAGVVGRVEAALELAQDDAEEQVAPGGLGEGAVVAPEDRKVLARGVGAIDGDGCRRSSAQAATTPPMPPNRWPCHETPGVGTSAKSSVAP